MRLLARVSLLQALLVLALRGQEITAGLNGLVTDPGGAIIASAELSLTHADTGLVRKIKSDNAGAYAFTAMPIGRYTLEASHAGFKKMKRDGIELHIGDHVEFDVKLQVGDMAQEVTVTASTEQVELETSEQGGLISGDQVRELQLNGRSFMTLLELLPGVSSNLPDRVDPNTSPDISINGARSSSSSFNIDGGNNSDVIVGSGSLNTFTSIESIAEFKVVTSTFAAEYGRGGFSQVNVVTRGGGKNIHGSVFHFLRNDAFDARDWFTHQVLPLKLNNFGYTIGGPVSAPFYNKRRNKTFFFFTQEFNLLSQRADAVNTTVPTAANIAGDFTGRNPVIIDPANKNAPFPDNRIPLSRMDPNGQKLLSLFPAPNFAGPGGINYTSALPATQNWREDMVRIDHTFSPAWKIFGRYAKDKADVYNPYGGTTTSGLNMRFPGVSTTTATRPGSNITFNLTGVISQKLLNEFSATYSSRIITQDPSNITRATRKGLGINIPELYPENDGDVIPTVALNSNYASISVARVYLKKLFNAEVSDNVTRIAGKHTFKFGGTYSRGGNRENPTAPVTNGSFSFNTGFTRDPVANLLLGLPLSYSEAEHFVVAHTRFAYAEAFVQDDFKVTSRLTLNYGLRYAAYFNPYDTANIATNFLPARFDPAKVVPIDPATGLRKPGGDPFNGLVIAGKNSPFGNDVTNNNTNLWGPRFGFAWDLFGKRKTALRGGYGIFYSRPLIGTFINSSFDNPPFAKSVTLNNVLLSDPLQGQATPDGAPTITALGVKMNAPTIQQWSLGVQQDIGKRAILNLSYVASKGTHLMRPTSLNNPEPGLLQQRGGNVNAIRPYLGWGAITVREGTADSHYHSFQASMNRRMTKALSFGFAYAWAKSIDNGSSERGGSDIPPDSRYASLERGPSDFDRKHVLTANYIYLLPNAVSKNRAFAAAVLNGWQLSGITRMFGGRPFDVQISTDVAGIGATQNQRPIVIANTEGPRTIEQWFNRNAFARPATGTFGNMGRNSIRGPGVHKWDASLFKNFRLGEHGRNLQFRSEFFNVFNHASFAQPATSLTTTATGVSPLLNNFAVITGTRDARVLQFALKLSF